MSLSPLATRFQKGEKKNRLLKVKIMMKTFECQKKKNGSMGQNLFYAAATMALSPAPQQAPPWSVVYYAKVFPWQLRRPDC